VESLAGLRAADALREDPESFQDIFEEELDIIRRLQDGASDGLASDSVAGAAAGAIPVAEEGDDSDGGAGGMRRRLSELIGGQGPGRPEDSSRRALSELLHLKVIHGFQHRRMPLVPPLTNLEDGAASLGDVEPRRLVEGLYSEEALALVRDHVMGIIGEWDHLVREYPLQISLFQAGQVYAISSLFGYSLRRADARYQLEKMAGAAGAQREETGSLAEYVATFGPEEARQMATIASLEAEQVLERQFSAVFGDIVELQQELLRALDLPLEAGPEGSVDQSLIHERLREAVASGEVASVRLTVSELRRLALEGCAFGLILGASEAEADSACELTPGLRECPVARMSGQVEKGLKFTAFRL